MQLKDGLKVCHGSLDSADAFLLQRIGVMHYKNADYFGAVDFTLSSLQILNVLEKNVHVNPIQKFKCYLNLTIYYDSLGLMEKMDNALDSCISIGFASSYTDSLLLYKLSGKVEILMEAGDYSRSIDYAVLGQIFAEKYGYQHSDAIRNLRSWKVNALIFTKNFPAVAVELKDRIQEYSQYGSPTFTGNLYALWAEYYKGIGEIDSALMSYTKALQFSQKSKSKFGYAASLSNIGIVYFENLHNYPNALNYYFKALNFSDVNESISIFTNIGNVYTKKNFFDSAFYFYQKAFDQIHPGMDENWAAQYNGY